MFSFIIPVTTGIYNIYPTLNYGNPDSIFENTIPLSTPMNQMTINP